MDCDEECIRTIIREELEKISFEQPKSKKSKKERKKSQWNIFLSECAKRQPKDMALGDRTKACSIEYRELKKNNGHTTQTSQTSHTSQTSQNNR